MSFTRLHSPHAQSMEFQPEGLVTVKLKLDNDRSETYEFNKITTCIHNLFGADRYVDLYGQCVIRLISSFSSSF